MKRILTLILVLGVYYSQAQTVEIDLYPSSGIPESLVTIYGSGFSSDPFDMSVDFGGVSAFVLESTPGKLIVQVPTTAVGPLEVSVSGNGVTSESSGNNFTVLSSGIISTFIDYREFDFDLQVSVANSMAIGDLDNDGDQDLVYDNGVILNIAIIENGVIQSTLPITTDRTLGSGSIILDAEIADVNEDGLPDVVAAGSRLGWFENLGGGSWTNEQVIDNASSIYEFKVFDVNKDLDVDLVVDNGTEVVLFDNNGAGTFTKSMSAVSTSLGVPFDWNEDGQTDMISFGTDGMSGMEGILLFTNNGSGTSFTESTITTTSLTNIEYVQVGDLNDDSQMDFVYSTDNGAASSLGYILNNGSGFDTPIPILNEGSFSTQRIELGDLDGNGLVDIARTKKSLAGGIFEIYYGSIDPTFAYLREQLDSSIGGFDLALVDIEGDGDLDILQESSRSGGYFPLYLNAQVGNEITSFTTNGDAGAAAIDETEATVVLQVNSSLDITSIAPTIGLSPGATVSPASGVVQNFTNDVTYTVTSEAGDDKVWTVTINQLPAVPVLSVTTNDIGQTTTDVSWDEATAAVGYELQLSTTNTFSSLVTGYDPLVINNGATTSVTLSGLTESTDYFIRIRSKNKVDTYSSYSTSTSFLTRAATPAGLPATDVTADSFTANWSAVNGVDDYLVEVSNDNFASTVFTENTTSTSVSVTGLTGNTQYQYRVLANNNTGSSPYSNQVLVTTDIADTEAPVITLSTSNPDAFDLGSGTQSLSATITDLNIGVVTFYVRALTATSFTSSTLTGQNDVYSVDIAEADLDQVGIEYYFEASDLLGNTATSDRVKLGISYPASGEGSQMLESVQKFGRTVDNYQLISIPYEFSGSNNRVDVIFDEYGGNPDNRTWRIIRFDNGIAELVNLTGSYQVQPGEGYFFIAEEQKEIAVGKAEVNTQDPFVISLKAGWNLIGNPYHLDIDWNSVLTNSSATGVVRSLRILDPNDPETWPESTTFTKFEGAFVQADQDIDLTITYQDLVGAGGRRSVSTPQNGPTWFLPISVEQGDKIRKGGVGMDAQASESLDQYDDLVLPRWLEYLELGFLHEGEKFNKFNTDVVNEQDRKIWDFKVSSSNHGPSTLNWGSLSQAGTLKLLDVSTGKTIDMTNQSQYTFELKGERSFKLLYSSSRDASFDFDKVTIRDAYPSPFLDHFNVPVILTPGEEHTVTVSLIDLSGKVVWEQKNDGLQGGAYEFLVNSPDNLNTGVYLYRVVVTNPSDTYVHTKRITLK